MFASKNDFLKVSTKQPLVRDWVKETARRNGEVRQLSSIATAIVSEGQNGNGVNFMAVVSAVDCGKTVYLAS